MADIRRIDRIAPYMVEGAILRNSDDRSESRCSGSGMGATSTG